MRRPVQSNKKTDPMVNLVTPTGLLFLCAGSRVEKSRLKPGATRAARRRGTLLLDFDLLYLIR